jgi:dCTP deaminase
MILCNVEIQKAIDAGRLVVDPEPQPRNAAMGAYCPYDTHSVDLRLADEIVIPDEGTYSFDLMQPGSLKDFISKNSQKKKIDPESGYPLAKGRFILCRTMERIHLPVIAGQKACLAARIEGKSSRARCGVLVHFTAPTVHPGFEGTLTLEMINLGPVPFVLRPGMPIAQLIVE